MFDEDDYYSDEEENLMTSNKNVASSKVLVPNSGSDFNHLAGEGESLMKIMKERGCTSMFIQWILRKMRLRR